MKIQVLDHGYVEFVEAWGHGKSGHEDQHWGSTDHEVGIIEAARQSTQGGFRGWEPAACDCGQDHGPNSDQHNGDCTSLKNPGDRRLLSYLYSHKHMTPFEFAGAVLEIQAPIFVFREWQRHRTQSYNEASARYAPLPDLNYMPTVERLTMQGGSNKQAQSLAPIDTAHAIRFRDCLVGCYELAQDNYEQALTCGIPKELARLVLPVGRYSKMRASANLRNWLAFMTLRCDPAAQWEIRQYANAVANIVAKKFPHTFKLWAAEVYGDVE